MCQFIQNNWKELSVIAIAIGGALKYFDTRRRELRWKRTEFISEQGYLLDSNNDISEAVRILEGRNKDIKIDDIFDDEGNAKESYNDAIHKIDKLLNLLDRLACAFLTLKTINISEILNFGWYIKKVVENEKLSKYCNKYGFEDILKLHEKIRRSL